MGNALFNKPSTSNPAPAAQPSALRQLFGKVSEAQFTGAGRYITPGEWALTVKAVTFAPSRKNPGQHNFIAEFEVVETTADDFRPGDSVTWIVVFGGRAPLETCLGNVRNFLEALTRTNLASYEAEHGNAALMDLVEQLVSPEQPAAGIPVACFAADTTTKAGGSFTKCAFRPVDEPATDPLNDDDVPF